MTQIDVIKNTIDMGHMVLTTYLSDLSDADLMVRAVPGTNHIAWQLGHLIASEHQMMTDSGFKMPNPDYSYPRRLPFSGVFCRGC